MRRGQLRPQPTYCLLAMLLVVGFAGCQTAGSENRSDWSAQKPVVVDGAITGWTPAPEFLAWRQADPEQDGFSGPVLRVSLTGPFIKGAWSQHAGAIWQLPRAIPAGQAFTVRFKARRLEGSPHLTVLRTWGGAKPWATIEIDADWRDYEVTLEPQFDTDRITFSLVPRKGRLQPYCAGIFEVTGVTIVGTRESQPRTES